MYCVHVARRRLVTKLVYCNDPDLRGNRGSSTGALVALLLVVAVTWKLPGVPGGVCHGHGLCAVARSASALDIDVSYVNISGPFYQSLENIEEKTAEKSQGDPEYGRGEQGCRRKLRDEPGGHKGLAGG